MKQKPTLEWESKYINSIIAGVDEVGRGPWAGPVVASAVILDQDNIPEGINDSKKLSESKRERIFAELMQSAQIGIGMASVEEIDKLNILAATKLAMQRAIQELNSSPEIILVDGNQKFDSKAQVIPIIKGDSISLSIAAASIVAKVTRDRLMKQLALEFPFYGFEANVGYGTKRHREGLASHGITEHHRQSFKPIAILCNN